VVKSWPIEQLAAVNVTLLSLSESNEEPSSFCDVAYITLCVDVSCFVKEG
jgi:hypothetical protein